MTGFWYTLNFSASFVEYRTRLSNDGFLIKQKMHQQRFVNEHMACGRRQPPRLVNLHSFGLTVSLGNTVPKWPPYATDQFAISVICALLSI